MNLIWSNSNNYYILCSLGSLIYVFGFLYVFCHLSQLVLCHVFLYFLAFSFVFVFYLFFLPSCLDLGIDLSFFKELIDLLRFLRLILFVIAIVVWELIVDCRFLNELRKVLGKVSQKSDIISCWREVVAWVYSVAHSSIFKELCF